MTKFKAKNKGIEFRVGKSVNMIPSKNFPLASRNTKDIKVFTIETTEEIKNEKTKEIFNKFEYRIGRCFDNAKGLKELLEKEGIIGWEYYSGWLFPITGYPVFHAWLVKGQSILDYTDYIFDKNMIEKITLIKNREEQRKLIVDKMAEKGKLPASETKIYGKVHQEHIFIGTSDTYKNSISIMRRFTKLHPSYSPEGMNLKGLSQTQLKLAKITNST